MTTYEHVNKKVEYYFAKLTDKIEAGDITKAEALKRVSAPFIYECLKLTDRTVANMPPFGFQNVAHQTIMDNVTKINSNY